MNLYSFLIIQLFIIDYLFNCFQLKNSLKNVPIIDDNSNNHIDDALSSDSKFSPSTIPDKWEPFWNELFPRKKSISSVRFYLYTRLNPTFGQELCIDDIDSINQSNYNVNKRTTFLINGWQDNRFFAKWVRQAIYLLLQRDDQNVIFVGWQSLNELFIAAMIIKDYSLYLAKFINFLKMKYNLNGEQIHCIGHSLGGFMCGFAGDETYIGRATVMDAGPRPYYQNKPAYQRLNRFQAGFMDVIHSDFHPTFSLGLTIPYGDLDFFPNSGTVQQGCWKDKYSKPLEELLYGEGALTSLFQIPRYLLFCSHYRSHEWFFESLSNKQCQFIGVLCPNYEMFINGECSCDDYWIDGHGATTCALMGYDAEYAIIKQGLTKFSPKAKWFLKTSDFYDQTKRHCQYQYQLVIKLGKFLPLSYYKSSDNITITISFITRNPRGKQIILNEIVYPNMAQQRMQQSTQNYQQSLPSSLQPNYRLTKLILQPHALPLKRIKYIMVSLQSSNKNFFITISWIKLSPIQIVNNEPNYYCHLNHFIWSNQSKLMKHCTANQKNELII